MSKKMNRERAQAARVAADKAAKVLAEAARLARLESEREQAAKAAAEKRAINLPAALTHFKSFSLAIGQAKAALRRDDFVAVEASLTTARAARNRANELVTNLVKLAAVRKLNELALKRQRDLASAKDRAAFEAEEKAKQERREQAVRLANERAAQFAAAMKQRQAERVALELAQKQLEIQEAHLKVLAADHAFVQEVTSCFDDGWRRCHLCLLKAAELCIKHGMLPAWVARVEEMNKLLTGLRNKWGVVQLCNARQHRRHVELITSMIDEAAKRGVTPSYDAITAAIGAAEKHQRNAAPRHQASVAPQRMIA